MNEISLTILREAMLEGSMDGYAAGDRRTWEIYDNDSGHQANRTNKPPTKRTSNLESTETAHHFETRRRGFASAKTSLLVC